MKLVLYPFMLLSACGLALSVVAHAMALAGLTIPGGNLVFALHIGIFVVWFPAVIISGQMTRHANRKDFWKVTLSGCPSWMQWAGRILFGYAILNFVLFIATNASQGRVQHADGEVPPAVVRGFSGHWVVFYGAAFAMFYSRIHAPELYRKRQCPQGHEVSPVARFCPECGHEFVPSTPETTLVRRQ